MRDIRVIERTIEVRKRSHRGRRHIVPAPALLFVMTLATSCLPVLADQIGLGGDPATCTWINVDGGPAAGAFYQYSCSGVVHGDVTFSNVAQGSLDTGTFGVKSTFFSPGDSGPYGGNDSFAGFNYFFDTPGITSGVAVFYVSVDPTFTATAYGVADGSLELVDPAETSPLITSGNTLSITSSGPLLIPIDVPFTNGESGFGADLNLAATIDAAVGCANDGVACSATADFLDPVTIQSVTVFDASGNVVPDVTLVSTSGFTISETPEPNAFPILAMSMIGLLMRYKATSLNRK
jgi:hypothetical protein